MANRDEDAYPAAIQAQQQHQPHQPHQKNIADEIRMPLTERSNTLKKRVFVTSTFTPNEAASSPSVASWSHDNDSIFQKKLEEKIGGRRGGSVKNVVPLKITVLQYSNSFAFPLVLTSSISRGNLYGSGGVRGLLPLIPTQGPVTFGKRGRDVHFATKAVLDERMNEWAPVTEQSLEEGIEPFYAPADVNTTPMNLVKVGHPILNIISNPTNQKKLGLSQHPPLMFNNYYLVPTEIVDKCKQTIKTKICDRMPYADFSSGKLVYSVVRADGFSWDSTEGIPGVVDPRSAERILNTPATWSAEIEHTYVQTDTGAASEAASKIGAKVQSSGKQQQQRRH